MTPRSRLRARVSAGSLLIGNVGRAATQALLLWIFADRGGAAHAGDFALALAILSPVFMLAEFGLRNVYQTLHERPAFWKFLAVRAVGAAVAFAFGIAAALFIAGAPPLLVMVSLASIKFADSILDILKAWLLAEGRYQDAATTTWINVALTLLLVAGALLTGQSAPVAAFASAAASALVAIPLCFVVLRAEATRQHADIVTGIGGMLRAGTRLGLAQFVISVVAYVPVFYLSVTGTAAVIGVFAACQYAVTLTNLVFSTMQQISLRELRATWLDGGSNALRRVAQKHWLLTVGAAAGIGAAFVVGLPFVLPVVFGGEFQVTALQVLPLGLAMAALGADYVADSLLMAANRYGRRLVLAAVSLAVAVVVALVLGAPGTVADAAIIMAASYATRAVMTYWLMRGALRARKS